MKPRIYGLTMALLAVLCATRPTVLHAQEDHLLDKTVMVKADHERLEDVLNDLSKKGYFTFSYQSDILKKDRLITLTIRESTLRQALELILGGAYDYVDSDDYVIIRRWDKAAHARAVYVKTLMVNATPVTKMKTKARKGETIVKAYWTDSAHFDVAKQTARNIIAEMVADGIIPDKDHFTEIALDNGQFILDGRYLSDSVRVKYVAKFIGPDGNGYYIGTMTGIRARGFFFDKNEIYGKPKE